MAVQVASLFGVLSLRDDEFRQGMQNAQGSMSGMAQNLQNLGGQLQGMGRNMTLMTAPIAAGLGVAVNDSRNFSRAMSNVNAMLGISGEEAEALRAELLAFGGDTIFGPQATAEAFYRIVSAVQDSSTHMAILEQASRTAAGGQADLDATTGALISTMNAYNLQAEDAAWVSDVFSQTVAMGDTRMNDLAASMPAVTSLASQFGIGVDEIGGSLAFMTAQGNTASQSATMLRSMISSLLSPTADVASVIQELGFESGQALLEGHGLVGAYELLAGQAGTLAGLITNQEALTGSLILTKDGADEFFATYMEGIEGATQRQVDIQSQTESWDLLRSKLQEVRIMAGDQLEPILVSLFENTIIPGIQTVLDWAEQNEEAAQAIILVAGGAVILGPALMILGTIIKGVGLIAGGMTAAFSLLKTTGLLAMLGPVGLVAIALGGLAYLAVRYEDDIVNALNTAADDVSIALDRMAADTSTKLNNASNDITNFLNRLAEAVGLSQSANLSVPTPRQALMDPYGARMGRAAGGPVTQGVPYVVGERGPELFVPAMSGHIVPNHEMEGQTAARAGGMSFDGAVFNFYGNTAAEGREMARGFREELDMLMNEAG